MAMKWLRFSFLVLGVLSLCCATSGDSNSIKKMKMQFRVFEEYTQALYQRYPDIRIEGENYLPMPIYRHIASILSIFKLLVIGLVIVGKDPFALFGMQAPGIWEWGQANKIYACMMVFFFSNMIENQLMSTGAFEITLNDVPVWSKLESGQLPSMQQLVQILDNEMKMNVHMNTRPHHHS
uniref:Selenoprotein T n=1 Tax=Monopterus albus TaxID=43700 RepID=A0A3Q3K6X9_MONAL